MPLLFDNYDGTEKIKEIINIKIREIDSHSHTTWSQLNERVKSEFPHYTVLDHSYSQFPSYLLEILLDEKIINEIRVTKSIILNISLLSSYYTIYFQDYININKPKEKFKSHSIIHSIAYFNCCIDVVSLENALRLKKLVESYFTKYIFIDHRPLFDYKILGGVKYGDFPGDCKEYSLFEFLFDNVSLPNVILE